jgi:hypothetical protein
MKLLLIIFLFPVVLLAQEKTYDNDKVWSPENKNKHPYLDIQNAMRVKADSLLIAAYGKAFYDKNVIWSIDGSYIYNEKESGKWTDSLNAKPTIFLFRYNVKLDSLNLFEDMIEFKLDSLGKYIPNKYETIYGFEKVPKSQQGEFKISIKNALLIAQENGLLENDSVKVQFTLKWENIKNDQFYKGQFRFYVVYVKLTIEEIVKEGRSRRETKYDVYSFNPWTAEFIEKKKMKSINTWGKMTGSGTGLIPDNE